MNFSVCKVYFRVLAQGFSLIYVYLEKGKEVPIRHKVIGCLLILPYIAFEMYSTYADKSWWIDY